MRLLSMLAVGTLFGVAISCGQVDTGYWDHKVDCVDSCTHEDTSDGDPQQPKITPVAGPQGVPGKDGTNGSNGKEGKDGVQGPQGPTGEQGTVGTPGQDGINGEVGPSGSQGPQGPDGYSMVYSQIAADSLSCPYGGSILLLALDIDRDGILTLVDANPISIPICKGDPGQAGSDAPIGSYTPVGLVDPCGDAPGIFDEVFFELANGVLIATISDNAAGYNTRLGVVAQGSWVTTDGSGCHFTVGAGGISW